YVLVLIGMGIKRVEDGNAIDQHSDGAQWRGGVGGGLRLGRAWNAIDAVAIARHAGIAVGKWADVVRRYIGGADVHIGRGVANRRDVGRNRIDASIDRGVNTESR